MDETEKIDIFLISPVRNATFADNQKIKAYVNEQENRGLKVYWPLRDNPYQSDKIGLKIINHNLKALKKAEMVHIWYKKDSFGSFADFEATLVLNKKFFIVNYQDIKRTEKESFENILLKFLDRI